MRLWSACLLVLSTALTVSAAASPSFTERPRLVSVQSATPAVSLSAPARPDAVASQKVHVRAQVIPTWLRNLVRRVIRYKTDVGEITRRAGEEALTEWLRSGAKLCPSYLPAPYFCPHRQMVWYRWGIGYALGVGQYRALAMTAPKWSSDLAYVMTVGVPYWLTCWTLGDRSTLGVRRTRLWYRLRSGNYANDGFLNTGINDVIPGVRHC